MLHADNDETHPFPLVTHPERKVEQARFVVIVVAASVQTRGLHTVDPAAVLVVQGPSEPIIPEHPLAIVYELQAPNVVVHPFPVVRHPAIHPLH